MVLMIQFGLTAWAGYVPPLNSPYWCYNACITPNGSNHYQCINTCYINKEHCSEELKNQLSQDKNFNQTMAGACCSWGENIKGCFPGC